MNKAQVSRKATVERFDKYVCKLECDPNRDIDRSNQRGIAPLVTLVLFFQCPFAVFIEFTTGFKLPEITLLATIDQQAADVYAQ
ncbi:MAG: hypothetical protein IJH25_09745 [Clostridia bacterium]|nr:hypothetical protein [Clostridia bacterium]